MRRVQGLSVYILDYVSETNQRVVDLRIMYARLVASLRWQKATVGAAKLIMAISAGIHYVISRPMELSHQQKQSGCSG